LEQQGITVLDASSDTRTDILIADECTDQNECLIWLKPKRYLLGIGCKKGKTLKQLLSFVEEICDKHGIPPDEIVQVASIDRKKDEPGLLALSEFLRVPFVTFSKEQLASLQGEFRASEFVESTVGVDNVCERAAMYAAGEGAVLLQKKVAKAGMTLAIAYCGGKGRKK
jgi:cobalt-precorrin 5A hydrolase